MSPLFVTGDPEWERYSLSVKFRPLSLDDLAGVDFRYHPNRHHYRFELARAATPGSANWTATARPRCSCLIARLGPAGRSGGET
jgi:hypothetical protein